MRFFFTALVITLILFSKTEIKAQTPVKAVLSIDGIVTEGLRIITGTKDEARDWKAFQNLFATNAQLSVLVHDSTGSIGAK